MDLQQQTLIFLNKGFLLRIDYVEQNSEEKYVYVMKGKWFNRLPVLDSVLDDCEKLYDLATNEPFDINKKLIQQIHYIVWPDDLTPNDVFSTQEETNTSLVIQEKDLDEMALKILELKLELQNHLRKNCVESFNAYDIEELQDKCTINHYPLAVEINEQTFAELRKKVISDFFTFSKQQVPEEVVYQALAILGLKQQYLESTDERLLNAIKRQWKRLIEKDRLSFLSHVTSIDLQDFTEEEKTEFFAEAETLKAQLDENISNAVDSARSIKEVISFWPKLLQPTPSFVYSET